MRIVLKTYNRKFVINNKKDILEELEILWIKITLRKMN
ncbi:Uncharacterised protein [Clostridium paraputrificum]|nr:Uncharacterised protein [Clostridium paraputrificum]